MSIDLREWLYPLGFLSTLAFGGRMLLQWLVSEYRQKSHVTRTFWYLSLVGNLLLMVHSLIQIQFHVCLVQTVNAVISWRNLNLMQIEEKQYRLRTVLYLLALALAAAALFFFLQGLMFANGEIIWFRIPNNPWNDPQAQQPPPLFHALGFMGLALFSSRFWVQWWLAEKHRASYLGTTFWLLSLVGTALSLFYFVHIKDPVNFLGPAFGMIPYIRNLMLMRKSQAVAYEAQK